MKDVTCASCGKTPLTRNEIGISKKLLGENVEHPYCLHCLADYLDVTPQDILDKIEEFKDEGCKLFE
jgi:biotin operon repressor